MTTTKDFGHNGSDFLTVPQAARLLSCHTRTLERVIRRKQLRVFHVGRLIRISRKDLDRFAESED